MAITQIGSSVNFQIGNGNAGTVSSTITVPADAEIVVVGVSGYSGGGIYAVGAMTFTKGGVDTAMTQASTLGGPNTQWGAGMYYMVLPDTGSNKTLKWDWSGSGTLDSAWCIVSVTFWKGIDTTTPVRSTSGGIGWGGAYTTGTLTAQSGDLVVAFVGAFVNTVEGSVSTWSNLTLLEQLTHQGDADGAWATGSPSGNLTVAASTYTGMEDGGIVAIVLQPATATVLAPVSDSADGNWVNEAGNQTNLYASIDDGTSTNDADFIMSGNDPVNDVCSFALDVPSGSTVADPFHVTYRYKGVGPAAIDLRVRLMEGATEIASWTHTSISNSYVTTTQTLTAPQLATIVNPANLSIEIRANKP